jgi:hypothetical protein
MAFEDHLKRTLDTAFAELAEVARAERELARVQALVEGRAQGWEDGREHGRFEGREEAEQASRAAIEEAEQASRTALEAAVAAARAELPPPVADTAAVERLLDGMRAIDRSTSLGGVLQALADAAVRESSRVAVLLVRGEMLRRWTFVGFPGDPAALDVELTLADAGLIGDAVRSRSASTSGSSPAFADPAVNPLAVPLAVAGEVVAILYVDDGGGPGAAPAGGSARVVQEALARHAARALESIVALKAARFLSGPEPVARSQEPDDADLSARRYARLLVSEIKLYHEPAVAAGRRDRDLMARLGGEIARARVLYEQRVPPAVRERADYFHDELVRTLANGDSTLLSLT